jgi:hypothetical protein
VRKSNWAGKTARAACFATICFAACSSRAALGDETAAFRLTLLDGQTVAGEIESIDPSGAIRGAALPDDLHLDDLRRNTREGASPPTPSLAATAVLELAGGGRLSATSATIADERCLVRFGEGREISLPIDALRAIRFPTDRPCSAFQAALSEPSETDRIFVKLPDEDPAKPSAEQPVQAISGLIVAVTGDRVVFEYQGAERSTPLERVLGIVTAQFEVGGRYKALVTLQDGGALPADSLRLEGENVTLSIGGDEAQIPWASVTRVDLRSERMTFLSDLDPLEAVQEPLVTFPHPWRRDLSVGGQGLSIGPPGQAVAFEKGLGVHAYSKLSFDCAGYDRFAAAIGLDSETQGRGDCVFRILGDGQTLFEKRLQGSDSPHEINLEIRGASELTLIVEPGEGLDLADRADWADARLLREKE